MFILLLHVCRFKHFRIGDELAGRVLWYHWTVQWCQCLAQCAWWTWSRLKICCWCWWSLSLGWISGLSSDYCPDKPRNTHAQTHTHTHTHTRIRWTHQPCTRSEASVPIWPTLIILSLSNRWRGFPGCHLCRWPLFRDSIQDPGRAGWQHARSTSELSYHWHQVSRRCHVFILWEFNPPFRMDQALCRWREAVQISVAGHTVPSLGNVKRITLGIQACLIAAALLVIMKQ